MSRDYERLQVLWRIEELSWRAVHEDEDVLARLRYYIQHVACF